MGSKAILGGGGGGLGAGMGGGGFGAVMGGGGGGLGAGSLLQKLRAGAAAEAKGEQNPGLLNNNNGSKITSSSSSNNNNTEGKGKKTGVVKALQNKKSKGDGDTKQLTTKKTAENEVRQSQPQAVDWSAWDAC